MPSFRFLGCLKVVFKNRISLYLILELFKIPFSKNSLKFLIPFPSDVKNEPLLTAKPEVLDRLMSFECFNCKYTIYCDACGQIDGNL